MPPTEYKRAGEKTRSEIRQGTQVLLNMFDIVQEETMGTNRECFNTVVNILADAVEVAPLPQDKWMIGTKTLDLLIPYAQACRQHPFDYLGELFTQRKCSNDRLGQIITPEAVVRSMTDLTIGVDEPRDELLTVLDPASGTGRFLVDVATRYRNRKLALFGVELDLDLYRAALVNMRFFAHRIPYNILRADALRADLRPNSPYWIVANLWEPPDLQTLFPGPIAK